MPKSALKKISKPKVGIFWVLENGRLLVNAVAYDKSETVSGNYVSYSDHYNFWETTIRSDLDKEYTDYPRGRIIYNRKTGKSKIMAGKNILADKKIINKLVKVFKLKEYILCSDEHYEKANHLL